MAKRPEIIATVNALTATNSSLQAIAAASGKKLVGVASVNASTNTAVAVINHATATYTVGASTIFSSKITGGQYSRDSWSVPGSENSENVGLNIESGLSLRRLAGMPIVTIFTRKD